MLKKAQKGIIPFEPNKNHGRSFGLKRAQMKMAGALWVEKGSFGSAQKDENEPDLRFNRRFIELKITQLIGRNMAQSDTPFELTGSKGFIRIQRAHCAQNGSKTNQV